MAGKLPITLLSAVAWVMLACAAPADPTITAPALLPRQLDQFFIGYIESDSTWYSQNCDPGLTWYQSSNWGQCCPETVTSCPAPTACVRGSQIYPLGSTTTTIACSENYNNTLATICNTAFIYESFGDSSPITDIICGDSSVNWSYYRKVPATATEIQSELSTTAPSPGVVITETPTPSSSPSSGGSSGGKKKKKSKAWIAGAVVGPIIGIALIAALAFFLLRRNKSKKNANSIPQSGTAAMAGPPPGVTDAKPQMTTNTGFAQQPSPGINPNGAYIQEQGFNQQQGYAPTSPQQGYPPTSPAPTSPAPQYSQPYPAPGQDQSHAGYGGAYAPEKHAYNAGQTTGQPMNQSTAAELGGGGSSRPAVSQTYSAELAGDGAHPQR